ncbi:MAG: hypothetical protein V7K27_30760 [Nostoc sp.]|uniref:hypothetical protein n=1 Tax=Nostoc sp. TaxID=1180 RepID=UPI002FF6B6EF
MSRKVIQAYLDEIEQLLLNCSNTYVEEYSTVILTTQRANLRIKIRFALKYLLAVSEAFVIVDNQIIYSAFQVGEVHKQSLKPVCKSYFTSEF